MYNMKSFLMALFIATLVGCFPMYSNLEIEVPSPDGKITLKVFSRSRWENGRLDLEKAEVTKCNGYIKCSPIKGKSAKIRFDENIPNDFCIQQFFDVVWSHDSNFFAVQTLISINIYDKNGLEIKKYNLQPNQRVSTIHWRHDKEHTLYVVIKTAKYASNIIHNFFDPVSVKIVSTSIQREDWETIFSEIYADGWEIDFFKYNSIISVQLTFSKNL